MKETRYMSNKAGPRRLVVADWEATKRAEGTVILDLGDGIEISIDPPLFWARKFDGHKLPRTGPELMRGVVGPEQLEVWFNSGRTLEELDAAWTDAYGLTMGESGASSRS